MENQDYVSFKFDELNFNEWDILLAWLDEGRDL